MTEWVLIVLLAGILLVSMVVIPLAFAAGRRRGRDDAMPVSDVPQPVAAETAPLVPAAELIAAMPIAVLVVDAADRVVTANETARRMGVVRDGRVAVRRLLTLSHTTRSEGSADADLQLPASAGRPGVVTVHGYGVCLTDRLVGLILIDVTEQHRVEAVRRDFVANVSHELKTPIGAITLLGEAIEGAAEDQDAVRRFAMSMQRESKRLTALIAELIELSRLQGGEPSPPAATVRIADVVAESIDRIKLAAEAKRITIVCEGDNSLAVRAIGVQLVIAVTNLLSNAVSYSPEGTTVAVTYRLEGRNAEIVVKDQGIGIAPQHLDRLFERFFRVDRARSRATGGTGLGLAIVKHVATNHGGEVRVWSGEGAGSTFSLLIPVRHAEDVVPPRTDEHRPALDTAVADPQPAY